MSRTFDKINTFETNHPIASSIAVGVGTFAAGQAIKHAGKKHGLKLQHGRTNNEARTKIIEDHPVVAGALATLYAPVSEELVFRALPDYLGKKLEAEHPHAPALMRLGSFALFAAAHAGKDGIPVMQALAGATFQRQYDKHGLKGSIASHLTTNALAATHYVHQKVKK